MNQAASDDSNNSFPLFKPWDALALLRDVQRKAFKPGTEVFSEATNLFFFDLVTEHDSQNFSSYLGLLREEGVQFSAEFDAFEAAWRQDEWNHYLGYRRLYTICSGRDEDDVHRETIGRKADFQPMAPLLDEEFKICLVLAYDEHLPDIVQLLTEHSMERVRSAMLRHFSDTLLAGEGDDEKKDD